MFSYTVKKSVLRGGYNVVRSDGRAVDHYNKLENAKSEANYRNFVAKEMVK